jgi:hypothetical protein
MILGIHNEIKAHRSGFLKIKKSQLHKIKVGFSSTDGITKTEAEMRMARVFHIRYED